MLWVVLGPVLEYLNMGFLMVLEMMGVEQWTNLNTVISLLVIMGLFIEFNNYSTEHKTNVMDGAAA